MTSPLELFGALALLDRPGAADRVAAMARRERGFDQVHLAEIELPVGRLCSVLRATPALSPPRTGHLGNWGDIARGRAGALDFNRTIVERGLGHPLIYGFNRTEDATREGGDWVYLPGSLIEDGVRTELPLLSWDGSHFVRRTREQPLFVPFVLTELHGEREPLLRLQWERMRHQADFPFVLEAALILEHEPLVRRILEVLIADACTRRSPTAGLREIVGDQVSLDGRTLRTQIETAGAGFRMGDVRYDSIEALVDACLLPFRAATDPDSFFPRVRRWPSAVPRIGSTLSTLLLGLLDADHPGPGRITSPFRPHLQWGARDMAGYPPMRPGYFSRSSVRRSAAQMCDALIRQLDEVDPLYFVVMPAAIFMLWPTTAHPGDAELVSELLVDVAGGAPVEERVRRWLSAHHARLSSYFLERFHPRRSVEHVGELPASSDPVEPAGFGDLTVRLACEVVGALVSAMEEASINQGSRP